MAPVEVDRPPVVKNQLTNENQDSQNQHLKVNI